MDLKAGVGVARGSDGMEAGQEAARMALECAGGHLPEAALVFSAVRYAAEEVRQGVQSVLPGAALIGCSDAGIISQAGITKGAVAVMTLHKPGMTAASAIVDALDDAPQTQAQFLAAGTANVPDPCLHLLLLDGLAARGAVALRELQYVLGSGSSPLAGGCAGDGLSFEATYQFGSEKSTVNGAALLTLGGDLSVGIGVCHGFCPMGASKRISAAQDNLLKQISERPALEFYADYFGAAAGEIGSEPMARLCAEYPLGVTTAQGFSLVREVMHLRPGGELQVAGDVDTGAEVSLMTGTKQDLLAAAEQAAHDALRGLGGKTPRAALVFNCVGRLKVFGSQAQEEIAQIAQVVGPETPLLGFYTYGELAPVAAGSPCRIHNKTVVVILLA